MKLGFSTLGCPEWSWATILATAKDMGIDGIEIRGVEEELDPMKIKIFAPEHLPETLAQLRGSGIEIPLIASSVCLGTDNAEEQMQEAIKQIDFASANGIPFVRALIALEAQPEPVALEAAQLRYQQLCDYSLQQGGRVRVLIETSGVLADSKEMLRFVSKAAPETSGVLWDIHHPYRYFGEKPQETCAILGDLIQYVHIKDSIIEDGKLEYRMMGLGDLPIYDAVKSLHQQAYTGFLSLEWVKRWRPELRDPDVIFYHYQVYMETLLAEIESAN